MEIERELPDLLPRSPSHVPPPVVRVLLIGAVRQKHPFMRKFIVVSFLVVAFAGCKSPQQKQLTGTELVQDGDGHSKLVTYVTPEEYERMTPEERQRLHAAIGASVSVPLPGSKAPSEPISEDDFKKAYAK